ncbi:uncharacterized protein LOC115214781 [Octopus sinensis]|uniref:Uncharacterized protein LOC115214781 n=1 Tax=Octopus sinensis TaxID=2607531 RepID=A0A6P7SML9_9MOLL|nr:uncharacterized protein LOC115214781 [Octopus sinensis]
MPGIKANLEDGSLPLEILHKFLSDEIFQYIADGMIDYAENHPQHGGGWFPTTGDKIKVLLILMDIMKKATLVSYWNWDPAMFTPFFLETMPHNRFLMLLQNLHFNLGKNKDDRLHKICPIIDEVAENFRTMYVPMKDFMEEEESPPWNPCQKDKQGDIRFLQHQLQNGRKGCKGAGRFNYEATTELKTLIDDLTPSEH